MKAWLEALTCGLMPSGDLAQDAEALLLRHGRADLWAHCRHVGAEARRLALQFGADPAAAEAAGWLHDVSGFIPFGERLAAARTCGIEVLAEEAALPMILHQKLSRCLARAYFGVEDEGILSAIGCHTTLKAGASLLDKVVFLADKLQWDQPGSPPYLEEVQTALCGAPETSALDAAVLCYLDFLWEKLALLRRTSHPWAVAAHAELLAAREAKT